MITLSIMMANIMQGVDNSILNVALPHIQGSLSASQDQAAWALTSYIVCAAIIVVLLGQRVRHALGERALGVADRRPPPQRQLLRARGSAGADAQLHGLGAGARPLRQICRDARIWRGGRAGF